MTQSSNCSCNPVPRKSLRPRDSISWASLAPSRTGNASAAPSEPFRQCWPNCRRWSVCASSSGSWESRMWMIARSSSDCSYAHFIILATGPSTASSPIRRRASSTPMCNWLGNGAKLPSGFTKSFCRHCVIRILRSLTSNSPLIPKFRILQLASTTRNDRSSSNLSQPLQPRT